MSARLTEQLVESARPTCNERSMEFSDLKRLAAGVACILCLLACAAQTVDTCKFGDCIPAFSCPVLRPAVNLDSISSAKGVIDIIRHHRCGPRESRSVCCTDLAVDLVSNDILVDFADENSALAIAQLMTRPCGMSDGSNGAINGTQSASLFEFPWMAMLEHNKTMTCAGSLISDRYVLTAAHCLDGTDAKSFSIRLGEYDTRTEIDCDLIGEKMRCAPSFQTYDVEDVVVHDNFDRGRALNDIAMIRLKEKVIFRERIGPICLPVLKDLTWDIDIAKVAGWGLIENDTVTLRKAEVPVLSNEFCERLLSRDVYPSQMCAGGGGETDTCRGDSGGPLFSSTGSDFYGFVQYGILAGGGRSCIFTNVVHFVPWIVQNMKP